MYVERNEDGAIVSAYAAKQFGKDLELLEIDSQELIDFLNKKPAMEQ